MTRYTSKGKCSFCNETFGKAAMTKHLKSCKQRKSALETTSEKQKLQGTKSLHLVVEGAICLNIGCTFLWRLT